MENESQKVNEESLRRFLQWLREESRFIYSTAVGMYILEEDLDRALLDYLKEKPLEHTLPNL